MNERKHLAAKFPWYRRSYRRRQFYWHVLVFLFFKNIFQEILVRRLRMIRKFSVWYGFFFWNSAIFHDQKIFSAKNIFFYVFLSFLKNSKYPISRAKLKRKIWMLQNVLEEKLKKKAVFFSSISRAKKNMTFYGTKCTREKILVKTFINSIINYFLEYIL